MTLLEIKDLKVRVDNRIVINGVNLRVGNVGEVHVLMGPNAAGKTSLLATIMGLPKYNVMHGNIYFDGKDITKMPLYERAKMGIALAFQFPPVIKGVKLKDFVKVMLERYHCSHASLLAKILDIDRLMDRYLFLGFSGGERKRTELYLSLIQRPKLLMLDEPDSGVDIDSITKIANAIELYVENVPSSILLVTHSGHILSKMRHIDYVHIMDSGRIVYTGSPDEILPLVFKLGYKKTLSMLTDKKVKE